MKWLKKAVKATRAFEKERDNLRLRTILEFTRCYENKPVRKNRILFESFHGKNISDSPLFMLKEFLRRDEAAAFEIFYSTNDPAAHQRLVDEWRLPVKLVTVDTPEYAEVLATSAYLVNNSSFPQWFIKRDNQVYVQTWHGVPLKTLGKRMRLGIESMYNVQHNFLHADYITFPNAFTRDSIMRDYNLCDLYTGKVAMLGYPRNDIFHDRQKELEIRKRFGLDKKECFAYMPTWRGTSNHSLNVDRYKAEMDELLKYLDSRLGDNQVMYVNFHSMLEGKIKVKGYKHVKAFPKEVNNYEFLNAMDALVTDYSSVFFDYSVTGKPVVLYTYDLEEYLHDRGLYLDITDMPFPQVSTKEALAELLAGGEYRSSDYMSSDYAETYLPYESPDNSARAIDLLLGKAPEDVEIIDYSSNRDRKWNYRGYSQVINEKFLDDICRSVDPEKDILVLPRDSFGESMSAYLHDNFRDDFNFIFARNDVTTTYRERIMGSLSPARLENKLKARNEKRIFAHLDVTELDNSICSGVVESKCHINQLGRLPARVGTDGGRLIIDFEKPEGYELEHVVVVNRKWNIIWSKPVTLEDASSGHVECDIRGILLSDLIKVRDRLRVFVTARDESGCLYKLHVEPMDVRRTELCDGIIGIISYDRSSFTAEELDSTRFMSSNLSECYSMTVTANATSGFLHIITNHGLWDITTIWHGRIRKLSIRKNGRVRFRAQVDNFDTRVKNVFLKYRSNDENTVYPIGYSCITDSAKHRIDVDFNLRDFEFKEVHWDIMVCLEHEGVDKYVKLRCRSTADDWAFRIGDRQVRFDDGMTMLAYQTLSGDLAFTYREASPYENRLLRVKELCAIAVYYLFYPYWSHKRIWLVYEKFCKMAQDNGYYFFEYCMREKENRKHVYYIIDHKAKDYEAVRGYGRNVIDYMSFRHILYLMAARVYVGSDSKSHVYVWRSRPSFVYDIVKRRKIFFLQHGVTAMKRVDNLFGAHGSSPMTYFTTTSVNEQDIVTRYFGYKLGNAPIAGFARWDALVDRADRSCPKILVMPTWRAWLDDSTEETFLSSDYFTIYSSLLQSPRLAEFLEKYNAKLVFYIHPKLSAHLSLFTSNNERVELIEQGTQKLNQIMMESSMIITDYSSVAWDMLYMDKPAVYYQFDQERYLITTGSYIDFNTELPGDVCFTEDELFAALERVASNSWRLTEDAALKCEGWYYKKDRDNSRRTFEYLKKKGY